MIPKKLLGLQKQNSKPLTDCYGFIICSWNCTSYESRFFVNGAVSDFTLCDLFAQYCDIRRSAELNAQIETNDLVIQPKSVDTLADSFQAQRHQTHEIVLLFEFLAEIQFQIPNQSRLQFLVASFGVEEFREVLRHNAKKLISLARESVSALEVLASRRKVSEESFLDAFICESLPFFERQSSSHPTIISLLYRDFLMFSQQLSSNLILSATSTLSFSVLILAARYGGPKDLERFAEQARFVNEAGTCAIFEAIDAEREDCFLALLPLEFDVVNDQMDDVATIIGRKLDDFGENDCYAERKAHLTAMLNSWRGCCGDGML